uniref:Uncharacterized protein n=1 Tax=Amphimedon queenslandica TaxID=400682 RepID=A0A1X7V9T3_AMPQE
MPPVNGRPVFNINRNKLVKTRLGAANASIINEEQKGNETLFKMLDSVALESITDKTINGLKSQVFKFSIHEKYMALEIEEKNLPICQFSTVDACQKINEFMLQSLETEKIE